MNLMDYLPQLSFGAITALATANAYFIRGLVKKIETSAMAVQLLRKDLTHMNEKLDRFQEINQRLIEVEKKIAILEFRAINDSSR